MANDNPQLALVQATLSELEALCGRMERALSKRDWSEIQSAVADARRVTHALQNAMDDAAGVRTPAFDADVMRRLRYVGAIRDNQMKRLQQYHDAVGERLKTLARWKSALRSFAKRAPVAPSLNDIR